MKAIGEIIGSNQIAVKNTVNENNEISIYSGTLTIDTVKDQVEKLHICFPELSKNWFEILIERIKENNFSDERLIAAVNNCIDSFVYGKQPNIANILNFNKTIKLLNYGQLTERINAGEPNSDYIPVDVGFSKPMFCHFSDFEKSGLSKFKPKK